MKSKVTILLIWALAAQAQRGVIKVKEPQPNLGVLKDRLTRYHDCPESNCYQPQLEVQSGKALRRLQQRVLKAAPGEKLALVLDVDETSLSNWVQETRMQYGYTQSAWNTWVHERACTAIAGTLRLYQEAEKDKVAVFFITGRPEDEREDTAANLQAVGYTQWDGLSLRALDHPQGQTVIDYKSDERARIVAQGYKIILNVGDQLSDLEGKAPGEISIKLPNPFYFIP